MAQRKNARRDNTTDQPEDAIALLKADHQRVQALFQDYKAATDPKSKREIAEAACTELEVHAQLEEHIFYPAVNEETDEGPELVKESLEEHAAVKKLIQELREMRPEDTAFDAKFHELIHNVEHHVEEEEARMFPVAEAELEEDMDAMMDEMQELKEQLLTS